MNDIDLTYAASRAARMRCRKTATGVERYHRDIVNSVDYWLDWAPLHDNGDAFALAAKLRMCVDMVLGADCVTVFDGTAILRFDIDITAEDYEAAVRRAIVEAAAALAPATPFRP